MTFQRNEITNLFIWVHPFISSRLVIAGWENFIDYLSEDPTSCLLQVQDGINCSVVYDLELKAYQKLWPRYRKWSSRNLSNFVRLEDIPEIQKLFGLNDPLSGERLFNHIGVYGLFPGACVEHQAINCGLEYVAREVKNYGYFPVLSDS